jgi:hypothetical protein
MEVVEVVALITMVPKSGAQADLVQLESYGAVTVVSLAQTLGIYKINRKNKVKEWRFQYHPQMEKYL